MRIYEESLRALRELRPPEEFESDWDRVLDLRKQSLELVREGVTAAEAGDARRLRRLAEDAAARDTEGNRLARAIGLERCAGGG